MKETFFTHAFDETSYWQPQSLPAGVLAVFGIYLIREEERTHLCSLTASSWGQFVETYFLFDRDHEEAEQPFEPGQSNYFSLTKWSPTHSSARFTVQSDRRRKNWHEELWEEATFAADTDIPILQLAAFDAYQHQQSLLRRAENRPVLRTPALPLFSTPQLSGLSYEEAKNLNWI